MSTSRLSLLLLFAALTVGAHAGETGDDVISNFDGDSPLPLFASHDVLHVEIEGPLRSLTRERSNTDYYNGVLRYIDDDGHEQSIDLRFRTRGNYRRRRDTCRFPPVRLRVDPERTVGTVFEGQRSLKLVTHCRVNSDRFENYVLKEYLAYRILRLHTPLSFRVRLLRITWIDSEGKLKTDKRYGFLIEHKNELAARAGLRNTDIQGTQSENLESRTTNLSEVFQYLIGNTDFALGKGTPGQACCHNGILLTADDEVYYPVPYDFDFSGLVNAPYAGPNPKLPIDNVTTRLYRGSCAHVEEINRTVAMFMEKRDEVMALVDGFELLSESHRNRAKRFLDGFYDGVDEPREIERKLFRKCS